jgi:hypothetical protein
MMIAPKDCGLRPHGRGRRLGRQARHISTYCNNDGDLLTHEIIGKPRQAIVLIVSPTIVDASDVLTLEKTSFIQTLTNERNERRINNGRTATEQSDHRKGTLLRPCRKRPRRHRRAASLASEKMSRAEAGPKNRS